MLSYQHVYHAGNFADVHKHAILLALLKNLTLKPGRAFFMDTHAGRGAYDLNSDEAQKTGEAQFGIARAMSAAETTPALVPYLDRVRETRAQNGENSYPGSPAIAQGALRAGDEIVLAERHPGEAQHLRAWAGRFSNIKINEDDGFAALMRHLPPAPLRGLVLIDPSYEIKDEYKDLPQHLLRAWKKWPQGQFMIWYPILPGRPHVAMLTQIRGTGMHDILISEIDLPQAPDDTFRMTGSGIAIVNPPFGFDAMLEALTQGTAQALGAKPSVFWLDNLAIDAETGLLKA